jgi:phosphosulfolactate phosphohydrolase-like enzyme
LQSHVRSGSSFTGSFSARAVADWVSTLQKHLARRIIISVIAAGERRSDGSVRFATEDQLAAGAVMISSLGRAWTQHRQKQQPQRVRSCTSSAR